MLYRNRFSILAALVAGVALAGPPTTAPAAEPVFLSESFACGSSELGSRRPVDSRRLTQNIYGSTLSALTGNGMAKASSQLSCYTSGFTKIITFWTGANPDNRYASAGSSIVTSQQFNGRPNYVYFYLKPTYGEREGQNAEVTIKLSYSSRVLGSDLRTSNYVGFYADGQTPFERKLQRTVNYDERVYRIKSRIGNRVSFALIGWSYAGQKGAAEQQVQLEINAAGK